jgi:hypothetical protein
LIGRLQSTRITACICAAIVTSKGIMDMLSRGGLDPKHVVITLNSETGRKPYRHRCRRSQVSARWEAQ